MSATLWPPPSDWCTPGQHRWFLAVVDEVLGVRHLACSECPATTATDFDGTIVKPLELTQEERDAAQAHAT